MKDKNDYPLFSRKEMDRRYNRARELMAARRIDALLVTGEENFHYFSGTCASIAIHNSVTRPSVLILPMDRDPIIVTQNYNAIALSTYVNDIRPYSNVLELSPALIADALKEVGWRHNCVGVELGQEQRMGIPVGAYLALMASMRNKEFVDAADIFIGLRIIKSAEEILYMKRAAEVTARARQRLFDGYVKPGVTERDVARNLGQLMLEEGADRVAFVHFQLDLLGSKNQFHYDRPLQKGIILGVDAGAYVQMYTIDYPRMATLGRATERQKKLYQCVRDINQKMAAALRPGVRVSDIHRIAAVAIEEAGVDPVSPDKLSGGNRFGHGQGMLITEPPSINPRDHTVLEPGMVLSTEPSIRIGPEHCQWEDVHVITEDGAELITLETTELREIPW
jgi:Xaa-Pro aminopeptidase